MRSEGKPKAGAGRAQQVAAALRCQHLDSAGAATWGKLGVVTGARRRILWRKTAQRLPPRSPAVTVA